MQPDFWIKRWEKNEIGFHRNEINPFLKKFGEKLLDPGKNVVVPLCGKSLDLLWIARKSARVTGIELSSIAIECFFLENELDFKKEKYFYSSDNITILEQDLFAIDPEELKHTNLVFDRASLIALPPELRKKYAEFIIGLNPEKILLITLDYNQNEMNGPPFSVSDEEVNTLYGQSYNIKLLESVNNLEREPRFREKGMTSLFEKCFLLQNKEL